MTVRPATPNVRLPQLATKARRALEQEAHSLKAALDEYASGTPASGCPHEADVARAQRSGSRVRKAQRHLLASGQQQARLMLINAYDHLVSMGRLLGSDGRCRCTRTRPCPAACVRLPSGTPGSWIRRSATRSA